MTSLLMTSALRVDVGGHPAIDGLSFETTGGWVLVLGASRALFQAAAGLRPSARGEVRVEGALPGDAVADGVCAVAPLDPPLPPRWTVAQYATWSARLGGNRSAAARAMAAEALSLLRLEPHARTGLARAPLAVRRAAVVAAAIATGSRTLLVEDPNLRPARRGRWPLARLIVKALGERRAAFFAGRIPLDSPIALAADEAVVIDGSAVDVQGDPADIASRERGFAMQIMGDVHAFASLAR